MKTFIIFAIVIASVLLLCCVCNWLWDSYMNDFSDRFKVFSKNANKEHPSPTEVQRDALQKTGCYYNVPNGDVVHKVLCTANFESCSLRNPTKVIAVSGGAVNALEAFCKEGKNKYYNHVDFVAITDTCRDKLVFQENSIHKLILDTEKMRRYRNVGDNTLLHYALDYIVGNDTRHVVFVHTFGSTPPDVYLQYLKWKNVTITLLATKPYQFEGTIKRERVEKQLMQSKKHTDHLVIIDAEDVRKAHPEMTLFDAFPLLDKVIGDKIEAILGK